MKKSRPKAGLKAGKKKAAAVKKGTLRNLDAKGSAEKVRGGQKGRGAFSDPASVNGRC